MRSTRRGAVLLVAIFIMSITCMFMADQARVLLLRMKLDKQHLIECQEWLLIAAAHERIALQQKLNAEYLGEIWKPERETPHNDQSWEVTIKKSDDMLHPWEIEAHLVTTTLEDET